MDILEISKKLGLPDSKLVIRKAAELRRLCGVQFDSSIIGVGEVCKAIIYLEMAATRIGLLFDRSNAIRLTGMSEKAYIRSYNSLHNGLGVKTRLDVRELAIQFGCVRIISFVRNGLNLYKDRFLSSLPSSRRASADFTRPVFTAVAFYLCAKRHKLKVDKLKLIELCGTSESEFSSVATSMKDLCHDVFGIAKEKKDPREVKSNRGLVDVLPQKGKPEDDGYLSDDRPEVYIEDHLKYDAIRTYVQPSAPNFQVTRNANKWIEDWISSVLASNDNQDKAEVSSERTTKQTRLNFQKEAFENQKLEAM